MKSDVTVVQADRDAAADFLCEYNGGVFPTLRSLKAIRMGLDDDHPLVQLLAKHRLTHSSPPSNRDDGGEVGRVPSEPGSSSLRSPETGTGSAFGYDPSRDEAAMIRCIEALSFYAIPENWHGVYMAGHGPMAVDWSAVEDDQYPDGKPGKLARETLAELEAQYPCDSGSDPEGRDPKTGLGAEHRRVAVRRHGIAQLKPLFPGDQP